MPLLLDDWHARYQQQARWTSPLRAHLFSRIGIAPMRRVLEVGCGTGAVLAGIPRGGSAPPPVGLDRDPDRLRLARTAAPAARAAGGDALRLPFGAGTFDAVLCHFLLLWVGEPRAAVREMARVTRRGGWVLALAEPDYGGRIDHPPELETVGRMQTEALRRQGADPAVGRRLAEIFSAAGIILRECGVLGARTDPGQTDAAAADLELRVLRDDLGDTLSSRDWSAFVDADRRARENGSRILFVPTFYAAGVVP
jgi:ubiquinone/menaquinone biosynthesis C-methylase UbiE